MFTIGEQKKVEINVTINYCRNDELTSTNLTDSGRQDTLSLKECFQSENII